jgi:hypothetical protein
VMFSAMGQAAGCHAAAGTAHCLFPHPTAMISMAITSAVNARVKGEPWARCLSPQSPFIYAERPWARLAKPIALAPSTRGARPVRWPPL